jgi:hypothetical protein
MGWSVAAGRNEVPRTVPLKLIPQTGPKIRELREHNKDLKFIENVEGNIR